MLLHCCGRVSHCCEADPAHLVGSQLCSCTRWKELGCTGEGRVRSLFRSERQTASILRPGILWILSTLGLVVVEMLFWSAVCRSPGFINVTQMAWLTWGHRPISSAPSAHIP
uniref:Uncharacterized protein n=1 Tax=Gopherus evgoodei TaxID=1825980 RepID=A0A8C4VWN7_9SAUR